MQISTRHLFHTSKAKDEDKAAISIAFSTLWHIIEMHQKQQEYVDINQDIKKRLRDDGDLNIAWAEIKHLKKPRQCWRYVGYNMAHNYSII